MPAYLSHAIMAEEVYNKSITDEKLFRIPIKSSSLKANSLGPDLTLLNNKLRKYDSHNEKTKIFFLNMIKFIKDNQFYKDNEVMSLLYGHICHYFLDVYAHPFIYYLESFCKSTSLISPHYILEGYISSYLTSIILKKDYMSIKADYLGNINLKNKKVNITLKETYLKTYQDPSIIASYSILFTCFKTLDLLIKDNPLITKSILIKLTNFESFLKNNNLTKATLTNEKNHQWTNPWSKEVHSESLIELYEKSIEATLEAINTVNKYLYDNITITPLNNIFLDLSYDTGIPCNPKKRIYLIS